MVRDDERWILCDSEGRWVRDKVVSEKFRPNLNFVYSKCSHNSRKISRKYENDHFRSC